MNRTIVLKGTKAIIQDKDMILIPSTRSINDRTAATSPLLETTWIMTRPLSETDTKSLNSFCATHTLTIKEVSDDRTHVLILAHSSSYETAFNFLFNRYQHAKTGKQYFANPDDIKIPSDLSFVSNILGLNDMPIAKPYFRCQNHSMTPSPLVLPKDIEQKGIPIIPGCFTPKDLATLYKFPTSFTGLNQSIAIIELGGGFLQQDLTKYFTDLGISPVPTVVSVSVNGATNNPSDTSGANFEVYLDIEVAGAIAPKAKIVVYFCPNSEKGFYDGINKAMNNLTYKHSIISISWGATELYWTNSALTSYNNLFKVAADKGINICCAAGDNGSSDGSTANNSLNVDFPGSSPYVISCGGTKLVGSGSTITSETVWNNSSTTSSTGGGYSRKFGKPWYQSSLTFSSPNSAKRGVCDVSANADPQTGYICLVKGSYYVIGGTSAVSPLFSGLFALLNQAKGKSIGFANPTLYNNKRAFNDILIGNNGAYSAKTSWDPPTGLGSPNGTIILSLYKAVHFTRIPITAFSSSLLNTFTINE